MTEAERIAKRLTEAQRRFAEDERFQGYMEGGEPDAPEPSANRSASYRHGFECARADLRNEPAFGCADSGRELAAMAELKDAGYEVRAILERENANG